MELERRRELVSVKQAEVWTLTEPRQPKQECRVSHAAKCAFARREAASHGREVLQAQNMGAERGGGL